MVTEDQDLQAMVLTIQKNAPIQHLHASAMQDRVRGAVSQSQASFQIPQSSQTVTGTDQNEQAQRQY